MLRATREEALVLKIEQIKQETIVHFFLNTVKISLMVPRQTTLSPGIENGYGNANGTYLRTSPNSGI